MNENEGPKESKYRTKCFINEGLRIASHREKIAKSRHPKEALDDRPFDSSLIPQSHLSSKDSLDYYNGEELYQQVYKEPIAQIHYPVKSRKVTAQGFVRDEPSLFERIMVRYDKWHK